jgi:hypothetical protein
MYFDDVTDIVTAQGVYWRNRFKKGHAFAGWAAKLLCVQWVEMNAEKVTDFSWYLPHQSHQESEDA